MVRVVALSGKADDIRECRFRNCGGEQAVCTSRWILSEPVIGGHYDWRIGTLRKWKGVGSGTMLHEPAFDECRKSPSN